MTKTSVSSDKNVPLTICPNTFYAKTSTRIFKSEVIYDFDSSSKYNSDILYFKTSRFNITLRGNCAKNLASEGHYFPITRRR